MAVITVVSLSNAIVWCIVYTLGAEQVAGYEIEDFLSISLLCCSALAVCLSLTITSKYIKQLKPMSNVGGHELQRIQLSSIYKVGTGITVNLKGVSSKILGVSSDRFT